MKKLKFETLFRGWIIFCVVLLGWALWANAQDQTTNAVAAVATSKGSTGKTGMLALPVAIEDEPFLTFGLDQVPFLQPKLAGNPRWQYLASLIYIILAFYISKFLDWFIREWLKKWAEKTETKFDDLLLVLLRGPVKVISFVIFLHIGLNVFKWPGWVERLLSKGLTLIVAISITYTVMKAIDLLIGLWRERQAAAEDKTFDDHLLPIVSKSLKVFAVVVSVLVTSQSLDIPITSVIALGSVGGLAVGLAAQDTLANLFGAIAIFVDKPFRIGDRVKLVDIEGIVESIGLRSTRVRNLDGHLITVPNKTMGSATITNITRRPNIKTEMNFGITYDTSTENVKRAIAILEEVYKEHPKTCDLVISFNKFADSALNILVVHWYDSLDVKEYLAAMQDLNLKIKERFDAEKINFAFPSRTVYLKQDSDWKIGDETKVETRRS